MNLDNYKAKPVAILMQATTSADGKTTRDTVQLISDDKQAIKKACDAYNEIAQTQKSASKFYVFETIGYFNE